LQPVKKFLAILLNPKVLDRNHKCLLPVPIMSQLLILSFHPRLGLPQRPLSLITTTQKVTSNVQTFPLHSQDIYWHTDLCTRRFTPTPSIIHNSNFVIMVSDWNYLKYFGTFFSLKLSGAQRLFDHPV
jgi:hypothetical protein